MYRNLIIKLQKLGIKFTEGLSNEEIVLIEKIYGVKLPHELKSFYKTALPISKGFYNWKDFSEDNIRLIKSSINKFKNDIIDSTEEIEWCTKWGTEPDNRDNRKNKIKTIVENAPDMLPIFAHRAMAAIDINNNPVFSIVGTDVIYYGTDIMDYFEIEFCGNKRKYESLDSYTYVPFWSDIL